MAETPATLTTTRYVRPGAYIGKFIRPAVTGVAPYRRLPCAVGKGHRLARAENIEAIRGFVYDEELTFTFVAPYRAALLFACDRNKKTVNLVDDHGTQIPANKWSFHDASTIEVHPTYYDANRTYTIDYQSTDRTVLDPIPFTELRGSAKISTKQNTDEFVEGSQYRLPVAYSDFVLDDDVAILPEFSDITHTAGAGVADVDYHADNAFTHAYSRSYTLVCTAAGGVDGARTASFRWSSSPISGGNDSAPHNPTAPSQTASWETFSIAQADAPSLIKELEYGVKLEFDFTDGAFDAAAPVDQFDFTAYAAPKLELDPRHSATNQFLSYGTVTETLDADSTGEMVINKILSAYTSQHVAHVKLECYAIDDDPAVTASFMYSIYGHESLIATGVFTVDFTTLNSESVKRHALTVAGSAVQLDFTAGGDNFVVGDTFEFTVTPPRLDALIRDTREYTFTVTAIALAGAGNAYTTLTGTWTTDTYEGGFGSFTTALSAVVAGSTPSLFVNTTGSTTGLPAGLRILARNVNAAVDTTLFAVGDIFTLTATPASVIDWALVTRRTETFAVADILFDASGAITGTQRTYYVMLNRAPSAIVWVSQDNGSGDDKTVTATIVAGTAYLKFSALPAAAITVLYEWRGGEPNPGNRYYVTANYLRPADLYNVPILVQTPSQARALLAPATADNDLLIAVEIGLKANPPGVYVVQIGDADLDGIFQDTDYRTAITTTELKTDISDVVAMNRPSVLGEVLDSIDTCNDPFARKQRFTWYGAAANTAVGDDTTADSLIYTAKTTLQVFGDSQSHGSRTMVAPTWVKYDFVLDNGQTQTLTLDGSFLAFWLACRNASFTRPAEALLWKTVNVFKEIQTYDEPVNNLFGEAQIIYFSRVGDGIYRIEEETTTDNYDNASKHINAMNQQWYMTRFVRTVVENGMVGLVLPTADLAASETKGLVKQAVDIAITNGIVGPHTDASGNVRQGDDTDVIAFADAADATRTHFRFRYNLQYVTKTVFGVFANDGVNIQ